MFTSQLGKKSSLIEIERSLGELRHITTEFCQGKTMRWAIAWTLDETFQFPSECQSQQASKVFEKNNNIVKILIDDFFFSLSLAEIKT